MGFLGHSRFDPLLMGSPLRRTPVALVVAAVLLLMLGVVALTFLGLFGSLRPAVTTVLIQALAMSSLMAMVPLSILWFLDRRERETPWLFLVAFLWGAVMGTGLALPFNNAILVRIAAWLQQNPALVEILGPQAPLLLGAPIADPLVEEVTKGLGLLLLFFFLRAEFDNVRDGFVYGALIGLGFNWFEAPLYIAQAYAQFGVAPWGTHLGLRYALFGLSGHAMFTGLFGAFLGLALQTRRGWVKVVAPFIGLGLAVAAHALNNVLPLFFALRGAAQGEPRAVDEVPTIGLIDAWLGGSILALTIFLPLVIIMAVMLWRSGVWERRVIREELAEEVGRTVSASDYQQILRDSIFRTRRIDRLRPALSAGIVRAQHELAFRKWRVRNEGKDPEADPLVAAWREKLQSLDRLVRSPSD